MKMLVMLGAARPDWADETPEHWCWWSSSSARRVLRRWSESQAMRAFIQLEVGNTQWCSSCTKRCDGGCVQSVSG